MMRFWVVLITLCLTACYQADADFVSSNQPDSTMDVKDKTQRLDLKPLSDIRLTADNRQIEKAYQHKQSDVWVEGSGEVIRLLADDNKGSRHQRFIVRINDKQTLLFAHNIDLAPRIDALQVGDAIRFKGEYEYNHKGGIVHWTHHDPQGLLDGGWISHQGKIYQ